jgi:hypothetical protein
MGSTNKRRRSPIVYDPGENYFWAGLLLCFTFGIMLAGIYETYLARDWWWLGGFVAGETGCVVLYFWIVTHWLGWMTPSADYKFVDEFVDLPDEHDNTGERRDS